MAEHSDTGPEASRIAREQQERLRRLRSIVAPVQVEAARAAGVTKDVWNRMELGRTRVDPIALARFCAAYDLPAGYVVTGHFAGLPDGVIRRLVQLEAEEAAP